jgi:hypothetical protein
MSLDLDAQRVLHEYDDLGQTGTMDSRQAMIHRTGLGWGRYLEAHAYMVNHLLVPNQLAIRYDPRSRLWTAGAERYNGVAGYDESKDYVAWHGKYLRTRLMTADTHLEAIGQAFPSKRRALRPGALHRYLSNAVAELDDMLVAL